MLRLRLNHVSKICHRCEVALPRKSHISLYWFDQGVFGLICWHCYASRSATTSLIAPKILLISLKTFILLTQNPLYLIPYKKWTTVTKSRAYWKLYTYIPEHAIICQNRTNVLCMWSVLDGFRHITVCLWTITQFLNTLRPRQNGCHCPGEIFRHILLNDWLSDKPLSEPMMAYVRHLALMS